MHQIFLFSFLFFSFKCSLFCIFEKTKTFQIFSEAEESSGRSANDGGETFLNSVGISCVYTNFNSILSYLISISRKDFAIIIPRPTALFDITTALVEITKFLIKVVI